MGTSNIPFMGKYLEYLPLSSITKYTGGSPKNGVAFVGYPQQHPAEKNKLILIYDPLGENPAILEFKIDDILFVEDLPQIVTEKGEGIPQVKLWIRRGSHGMLLEPFEVGSETCDEAIRFMKERREKKSRFMKQASRKGFSSAKHTGI